MKLPYSPEAIVAVLGGGQLGTMLATAGQPLRINVHCLDPNAHAPAAYNAQAFAEGEFKDRRTVEAFAKHATVATVEIEAVSTEGLRALRDTHGVPTYPSPEALEIIQDKGLQKQFFLDHDIPTAPFRLWASEDELRSNIQSGELAGPFVQKLRKGGYDGRGVCIVKTETDHAQLLPGACLTEQLADYQVELAVVAARSVSGEVATYPVVEMDFDPQLNLVQQLVSPARIPARVAAEAQQIATRLIEQLDIVGLLAVEFFLLHDNSLWVNEVAPRPHNSGHVTMNGFATSQFEQHLRAILNMPLGSTEQYQPALMLNILGDEGQTGEAVYTGVDEVLAMPGVHVHLYGKRQVRPGRKMGHVNVVAPTLAQALATADAVRNSLHCRANF